MDDATQYERTRPENLPIRAATPATAGLVVLAGPDLGRRFALGTPRLVVGRAPASGIMLDDAAVSRAHAEFTSRGGRWVVRDLGSTNGTYVNDIRLSAEHALVEGDRVRIGPTTFKFLDVGSKETAYHEEVYRRRTRDALTGAFNRAHFQEALAREWVPTRRGGALTLLLLDVDHFKQINDTHGHAAGDAVLRGLPGRMAPALRPEDVLARYGGEEFALLLPGLAAAGAREVAERIREAVAATPFVASGVRIPVTVSIGLAEAVASTPNAAALVEQADGHLYAAKRGGRNRVAG